MAKGLDKKKNVKKQGKTLKEKRAVIKQHSVSGFGKLCGRRVIGNTLY